MENASKALIMAGGVLIAILVIAVGIYLIMTYSQISSTQEKTIVTKDVMKFNSNFTTLENRSDITAQEIVTVKNFVDNYKKQTGFEVNITGVYFETDLNKFIKDNSNNLYKCNIEGYDSITGKVNSIKFLKIS